MYDINKSKCHLYPLSQKACEQIGLGKFWGLARWIVQNKIASESNNLFRTPVRGNLLSTKKTHMFSFQCSGYSVDKRFFFLYRFVDSHPSGNYLLGRLNLLLTIKTIFIRHGQTTSMNLQFKVQSSAWNPSISSPLILLS